MVSPEAGTAPGYPRPTATDVPAPLLISLRFRDPDTPGLVQRLREAVTTLAEAEGFIDAWIGRSTDEADLVQMQVRFGSVGAYRRALSPLNVRATVVPVLSEALDEPSAFEIVYGRDQQGILEADGALAADAAEISLGQAAGPWIAPAPS